MNLIGFPYGEYRVPPPLLHTCARAHAHTHLPAHPKNPTSTHTYAPHARARTLEHAPKVTQLHGGHSLAGLDPPHLESLTHVRMRLRLSSLLQVQSALVNMTAIGITKQGGLAVPCNSLLQRVEAAAYRSPDPHTLRAACPPLMGNVWVTYETASAARWKRLISG